MALKQAIVALVLLAPASVLADDTQPKDDHEKSDTSWMRYIARKHTLALMEAGIIVLPNARLLARVDHARR